MKSFTSRTTLITALAVAGVLVAGTAAIAANIGILNSTDDSSIGSLSATDDLIESTSTTGVPTTTATTTTTTTTTSLPDSPANAGESYVVDDAGIVTLSSASGELTLVSAAPQAGWTVTTSRPDPTTLDVTFTNGARTLVFSAVLGADGVVTADVIEPVDVMGAPAPAPASATSSPTTTIDDDHDDDHDDDRYEDDDHDDDDDDRYDDDHEYEGADDDD